MDSITKSSNCVNFLCVHRNTDFHIEFVMAVWKVAFSSHLGRIVCSGDTITSHTLNTFMLCIHFKVFHRKRTPNPLGILVSVQSHSIIMPINYTRIPLDISDTWENDFAYFEHHFVFIFST